MRERQMHFTGKDTRVLLGETDFHRLMHGEVVEVTGFQNGKEVPLQIGLKDIGYGKIYELLCISPD